MRINEYRTGALSFRSEKVADATEEHRGATEARCSDGRGDDDCQHSPDQEQLRLFAELEVI